MLVLVRIAVTVAKQLDELFGRILVDIVCDEAQYELGLVPAFELTELGVLFAAERAREYAVFGQLSVESIHGLDLQKLGLVLAS